MKTQNVYLSIGLLLASLTFHSQASEQQTPAHNALVFGILPFLSPVALMKRFDPLRQYLAEKSNQNIVTESALNFPTHIRRIINQEYDIIYTAPHYVPMAQQDNRYQLLAMSGKLAAHILVKASSPITNLQQLSGLRITHGPDQAFLTIVGKYMIKKRGLINNKKPIYIPYKSHNAAFRAVIGDEAEAAIVGTFLLKRVHQEGHFREIAVTPSYPGIAILASTELPQSLRQTWSETLISMKDTDEGRKVLKKSRYPGFKKALKSEYNALRPITLEALDPDTLELIK